MTAPAQEDVRAVYSGRHCLGHIAIVSDGFHARTADGRDLGPFASQQEAANALSEAHAKPVRGAPV